ncbi:MAG: hypothetical protein GXY76_03125 [Chloroflexi bacterium]|nr:hypothetical protein [Chloroflexota bacterium]
MQFQVGAKVLHPIYGAGRITAIHEKQFRQQIDRYYVIQVPTQRITVMVPVHKVDDVGLRPISGAAALQEMWHVLESKSIELCSDWKLRQSHISEKIRTGDILQIAQTIRDLTARRREQRLSQTDRELLEKAEAFLASELAVAQDMGSEEARALIRTRALAGQSA